MKAAGPGSGEQELQHCPAPPNILAGQPRLPHFHQVFQGRGGTNRPPVISRAPPPLQYQPSHGNPMMSRVPTTGKSKPVILRRYLIAAGAGAGDKTRALTQSQTWYSLPANPVQVRFIGKYYGNQVTSEIISIFY